jgi:hypothetical protein
MSQRKLDIVDAYPWLIIFFIWPFGSFVASLNRMGSRIFSVILVLFYFLYGYTYIIAGKDQDTYRTSQFFAEAATWSFSDLATRFENLFDVGAKPDIFQDLLQFLVSRVTDNTQVYFATTAVLFGIVAAVIFESVFADNTSNTVRTWFVIMVSLFLLVVLSPGRINSFRHYLAVAVFLLSVYKHLAGGGIKYLLLMLLTPLIHFAFIAVIPLVLVFKLLGNRNLIYYLLIVLSFLYADVISNIVGDYTRSLDENALQYHATQYTSEIYQKYVAELKTQRYFILDKYAYYSSIFFLALTIFHAGMVRSADKVTKDLFSMSLLIFAFVNAFNQMDSVVNRFSVLYQGFCCIFLLTLYLRYNLQAPRILQAIFLVVLLVNAVIVIRIIMQSASVSTLLLFFPVSVFSPLDVSILEWIK